MVIERHFYQPQAAEELLTSFFTGCRKEFGFLEQKHGFTQIAGLSAYKSGRRILTPFRVPCIVEPPFDATVLFERGDTSFEINYGGSHYALGLYVSYDRAQRFLLRSVFEAARKSSAHLDILRADNVPVLEKSLRDAGMGVRKNADLITRPGEKILERTVGIYEARLEQAVRTQHRRDTEDASAQAAKAFTAKDYRRVIELLTPYEEYLNAASAKQLTRARQKLLNI